MKVLLSILREMADLPADSQIIADALNCLGMAVETMEVVGIPIQGVVTARIIRTELHPDAAKLTRCYVDAGDGVERHVWCGATNMGPGDIVPLATIGTTMPDGREIARRGMFGIDSEGMLCSASELGLSADTAGILILEPNTPLGVNPWEVLGIEHDVIFDLDLTRNRPECWGHMGVARDIAAHLGVVYRGPTISTVAYGDSRSPVVVVDAVRECGMFSVAVISDVVVAESPAWVQRRLESLGMRSINNVVDASNMVMLECNQPNHAYDASVVPSFRVRLADNGETITTLDGAQRVMTSQDLLICDGDTSDPVGIAGVMGDSHSEITTSTSTLHLEMAWFSPDPIRFTSLRHNLRSEASLRFERGVDPEGYVVATERFVTILRESSPKATLHSGATVVKTDGAPIPALVTVSVDKVESVLGVRIESSEILRILESIGFTSTISNGIVSTQVPSWRPDCTIDVDIIEEVARHYGYERIGKTIPKSTVHGKLSHVQQRRRLLRQVLIGLGLDEVMPTPFVAPGDMTAVGLSEDNALRILNPLVADESILRTSLRPGLLKAVRYNLSHRAPRIALFEIGHVYPKGNQQLPDETEQLCILVANGDVDTALHQWNVISDALSIGALLDQAKIPQGLHATRSASLSRGKTILGVVGEVDPTVLHRLGIDCRVSVLEINLTLALAEQPKIVQATDINRFPSNDLDLAFVVPESVSAASLQRALRQGAAKRLVNIELFDVYRGTGLPQGTRSLAFRLRLQESGGTMTEALVADVLKSCVAAAEKIGASLRSP